MVRLVIGIFCLILFLLGAVMALSARDSDLNMFVLLLPALLYAIPGVFLTLFGWRSVRRIRLITRDAVNQLAESKRVDIADLSHQTGLEVSLVSKTVQKLYKKGVIPPTISIVDAPVLELDHAVMIYAGFWPRALAIIVDIAIWVPIFVLYLAVQGLSIPAAIIALLFMNVLAFAYPVYFLSRWGQTIGKMAAGIKVTRLDGSPILPRHAWLRSSVDIGLAATNFIGVAYVLAMWAGPEWSSLNWIDRSRELANRTPVFAAYNWASQGWLWSELVVLLLNKKRRALHDFIAGTVVIKTMRRSSIHPAAATPPMAAGS